MVAQFPSFIIFLAIRKALMAAQVSALMRQAPKFSIGWIAGADRAPKQRASDFNLEPL